MVDRFLPRSRVGHVRPNFMLWLVKIWQVSSYRKFMQHLETCLLWQLKVTEFFVNMWCISLPFSTGCTKWNTAAIAAIKSLWLFMVSLFQRGKLLPIHSLKWNPNNVLTTCKAISKGLASGFVYWSFALRQNPQINGLEKKQKHGGRRRDYFSLLYFGNSQIYWFHVAFQT